jgi:hypothetical protein
VDRLDRPEPPVSDSGTAGGKRRWYERLGMQINHPPPEPPPQRPEGYVRPSRQTLVAPARITYTAYAITGIATLVGLTFAGAPLVPAFALLAALMAQYTADSWWRHYRPPSADSPRKPLFSKNPDDYI